MTFFAILFAFLLEQVRPLKMDNPVYAVARLWVDFVGRNVDAGKPHLGWLAWFLVTVSPALLVAAFCWILAQQWGLFFAVLANVLFLYVTLGFRQFSFHFTDIRDALNEEDEARARLLLAQWKGIDSSALPRSEIVRHVIEHSVLEAHRHVFGVLTWFVIFSIFGWGVFGAVFYRLSEFVFMHWWQKNTPISSPKSEFIETSLALRQVAKFAWQIIDWLPVRLTALSFAVVGNFEEAIDGLRDSLQRSPYDNDALLLAAAAGAMDVRLQEPKNKPFESDGTSVLPETSQDETLSSRASMGVDGLGYEVKSNMVLAVQPNLEKSSDNTLQLGHLVQLVGLVWRAVVVWMLLLALLSLARLLG